MRGLADRVAKVVSDMTVGTVIVLLHVAMAEREKTRFEPRRVGREGGRRDLLTE
jgi:hypothetical protein